MPSNAWAVITKVAGQDPDLQRKGRSVAVILVAMALSDAALAVFNLAQGQMQYNLSNSIAFVLLVGLFLLNRAGYVTVAGVFTVTVITASALALLGEDASLNTTYVVMCIPILLASFLLPPWSGFLIAAPLIFGTLVISGIRSDDYPALLAILVVALIAYTLSDSLNKAYGRTRHQAFHDSLTGLPNRALFMDRLRQSIERKSREPGLGAVLFMDLDGFKVVNDSLGHDVGDDLLVEVAARLKSSLRPADTAARIGGDEFTILLDYISGAGDAVNVSERIAAELRLPFDLGKHQVSVTTSVGIALFTSPDASPDELLRDADVAMYDAKKAGKARYSIFNAAMYAKALERLDLEHDLRRAIEHGELILNYHPQVSLESGAIVGLEVLTRWEHPERGVIDPDEFISLAEETSLIDPLGRWTLLNACRQVRMWQERFPEKTAGLTLSVNFSPRQFRRPDLIEYLSRLLLENGLPPGRLQLEVTESIVMDDTEYTSGMLQRIESLGVRLSVDNFGRGYSSLAYFKRLPLDEIKIDRSFVAGVGEDPQDTAIVRLMIDLAHTVGVRAVAEGVETDEQLARLKQMGCDVAQGFFFWEPLTVEETTDLLARNASSTDR